MSSTIYRQDLAWIHHHGFGDFAAKSAPGLLRLLRRSGQTGGRLVDLGCGSGIWARAAQRAGFEVVGVDNSAAMLRLARQFAPRAKFVRASIFDFEFPACEVVTALGEPLNYRSDSRPADLGKLFKRIAQALAPGGVFIFDVLLAEGEPMNYRRWRSGSNWAALVEVSERPGTHRLTRWTIAFRKMGSAYRRAEEKHMVELFDRADIQRALSQAGFSYRALRQYGTMKLLPRRLAFVARKA